MKKYRSKFKEGIGYELYSKGADRVSGQCNTISDVAKKIAMSTRKNEDVKKRKKLVKELQKWINVLTKEVEQIVGDVDNLEGWK